jgi:hypothetical protein
MHGLSKHPNDSCDCLESKQRYLLSANLVVYFVDAA